MGKLNFIPATQGSCLIESISKAKNTNIQNVKKRKILENNVVFPVETDSKYPRFIEERLTHWKHNEMKMA